MKSSLLLLFILFCFFAKGQVGIGTDNPSATLDVVSNGISGTQKALEINNTEGEEVFTVMNTGHIGIGVPNPTKNLEVQGEISLSNSNSPMIELKNTSHSKSYYIGSNEGKFFINENNLQPESEVLTIKDNKIGINNPEPRTSLDISGTIIISDSVNDPVSLGTCSKAGEMAYYDDGDSSTSNFWGCNGTVWVEL